MASFFTEIQAFDTPFVDVIVDIANRPHTLKAKALSAIDLDALDAGSMTAYAKYLTEKVTVKEGQISERDSFLLIYSERPTERNIDELVSTRAGDIESRSYEMIGLNKESEFRKIVKMDEAEGAAYCAELDSNLAEARRAAVEEMYSEYRSLPEDEVARLIADAKINLIVNNMAKQLNEANFVYLSLYRPDESARAFESLEQIQAEWTHSTITAVALNIRTALEVAKNLPFVSAEDTEQNKQPSSPNTSEEATMAGGVPTKTTRGNSKRSTTPAS